MKKNLLYSKKLFLNVFFLPFLLILSVSCDDTSQTQSSQDIDDATMSSTGGAPSQESSSDKVQITVNVENKQEGLNLLGSADSYLLAIKCRITVGDPNSGDKVQYVGQKGNSFEVDMGEECKAHLEAIEVGGVLYKQDLSAGRGNYYNSENGLSSLVVTYDANTDKLGDVDSGNNYAPKYAIIDTSYADYSFGYKFQSVSVDIDDPNVKTTAGFLESKETDVDIGVAGVKAPNFKYLAYKDVNDSNADITATSSIKLLFEGEGFGSSLSVSVGAGATKGGSSKELSNSKAASDEGWGASHGVDLVSFSKGYQLSLTGISSQSITVTFSSGSSSQTIVIQLP